MLGDNEMTDCIS